MQNESAPSKTAAPVKIVVPDERAALENEAMTQEEDEAADERDEAEDDAAAPDGAREGNSPSYGDGRGDETTVAATRRKGRCNTDQNSSTPPPCA